MNGRHRRPLRLLVAANGGRESGLGANLGMTLLIPLGIHVANGGTGSLRNSLIASAGVSLLGAIAIRHVGKPDVLHMVLPVAQITAVVAAQRVWK